MRRILQLAVLLLAMNASAATKFYLHDAASTVAGYKDADLTAGSSLKTSVTNTTSGGTNIQITATAGGSAIKWLTKPLAANVTIAGSATCNIWGLESNGQANASLRCRYFKYSGGSEGSQLYIAQATSELTTSATVKNMSATPTSTNFLAGDRIAIYVYLENCSATSGCPTGTMGASRTVTVDYDAGTGGANGDSWLQITETVGVQKTAEAPVAMGNTPAATATKSLAGSAAAVSLANSCAVCIDVSYPLNVALAIGIGGQAIKNAGPGTASPAASLHIAPSVTSNGSGSSGPGTATIHFSCPTCIDLHYPNAITAAINVSPGATGEKSSGTTSAGAGVGLSVECEACRGIAFTGPTMAISPAVGLVKTILQSPTAVANLSPAASRTMGRKGPSAIALAISPSVSKTRSMNVSPSIALHLVAGPFSTKSVTVSFNDTPAILNIAPAVTRVASIHGAASVALGISPAFTRLRSSTRTAAVTVGISPGVPVMLRAMSKSVSASMAFSPQFNFSTTASYSRSLSASIHFAPAVTSAGAHPRNVSASILTEMTVISAKQAAESPAVILTLAPSVVTLRTLNVYPSITLRNQQTMVTQGNFTASVNVPMFLNNAASLSSVAAISSAGAQSFAITPDILATKQAPVEVAAAISISPSLGSGQAAAAPAPAGIVFNVTASVIVNASSTKRVVVVLS